MCVGLSAKVVKISNGTAVIDAGGAKREVSAQLLEDLEPGDYVMVHAGVAIAKITEEDDSETEHLMEEFLSGKCAAHIPMRFSVWESVNCCRSRWN